MSGSRRMWDLTPPEGMSEGLNLLRWLLAFVLMGSLIAAIWAWAEGAWPAGVAFTALVIGSGWGIERILGTLSPEVRAQMKADQQRGLERFARKKGWD